MNKQSQKVANNAVAIQAQRDVNVGLDAQQVAAIIEATSNMIIAQSAETARKVAEKRISELEPKLIDRITSQAGASEEALKDPDFHYALMKAEQAYARSGDKNIGDILVDLIGHRATQAKRTRLALSLNESVEKVALLTSEEFSALSLVYITKFTRYEGITNFIKLLELISKNILPFVKSAPSHDTSYSYLEAQSCGKTQITGTKFSSIFSKRYAGVLSNGFEESAFKAQLGEQAENFISDLQLIIPCLHNQERLQLNAIDKSTFMDVTGRKNISEDIASKMWGFFEKTLWSEEELVERIGARLPLFKQFHELWKTTALKQFTLTTVGIAIAHANARHVIGFEADLNIWIK